MLSLCYSEHVPPITDTCGGGRELRGVSFNKWEQRKEKELNDPYK